MSIDELAALIRARLDRDGQEIATAWDQPVGNCSGLATMQGTTVLMAGWRAHREVAAKQALLDRLLAEPHERFEEDHWYSCGALEDSDGTYLCYNDSRVGECTCGRDARIRAYLELLAQPYQETT